MPSVTVNGVDLAYEEAGRGHPLVLLHAGIVDRRMWADVMPVLARDFRVIAPDLRGYGDTPLPDGPFIYAADVAALLDALGIDVVVPASASRSVVTSRLTWPLHIRRWSTSSSSSPPASTAGSTPLP